MRYNLRYKLLTSSAVRLEKLLIVEQLRLLAQEDVDTDDTVRINGDVQHCRHTGQANRELRYW